MSATWFAAIAYVVVFLAMAVGCGRVGWRHIATFRSFPVGPPLVEEEILRAPEPRQWLPPGWPQPTDITNVRIAAAYRDYAFERRISATTTADTVLLVLAGVVGAAAGPAVRGNGWALCSEFVSISIAGLAATARQYLDRAWTGRARLYERRRADLHVLLMRQPRRRRWFGR